MFYGANFSVQDVVVACTSTYVDRANERRSGVGVETAIITSVYFEEHRGQRFIPVVRRRVLSGPDVPSYLASLLYIDMTDDAEVPAAGGRLAKVIWGCPEYEPPVPGPVPHWIASLAQPLFRPPQRLLGTPKMAISTRSYSTRSKWPQTPGRALSRWAPAIAGRV